MILPGLRKPQVFTSPTRSHLRVEKPGMMEYGSHGNPIVLPEALPSSSPSARSRPGGARQARDGRRGQPWSPVMDGDDNGDRAALHSLIHALGRDEIGRRSGSMENLQIQILAGYDAFDPARHDIAPWTAGFKRLVPDDASDGQVLRVLECKLPRQYADLLGQAREESGEYTSDWKEAVKLFLSRVSGGENRLSKLRKLKSLTQQPVRKFAIRVRHGLKRIRGREPTDQEWRDEVTVGALDATAMELDRIANQTPGNPSFWEVIKAVEFWERQHAALLNQGDPS